MDQCKVDSREVRLLDSIDPSKARYGLDIYGSTNICEQSPIASFDVPVADSNRYQTIGNRA